MFYYKAKDGYLLIDDTGMYYGLTTVVGGILASDHDAQLCPLCINIEDDRIRRSRLLLEEEERSDISDSEA